MPGAFGRWSTSGLMNCGLVVHSLTALAYSSSCACLICASDATVAATARTKAAITLEAFMMPSAREWEFNDFTLPGNHTLPFKLNRQTGRDTLTECTAGPFSVSLLPLPF